MADAPVQSSIFSSSLTRLLCAFVLLLMIGALAYGVVIAARNFGRIGV